MKKLLLISILTVAVTGTAQAELFTDVVTVNQLVLTYYDIVKDEVFNVGAYWEHNNPYPGDYNAALLAGLITDVTLTVNASDIDPLDDLVYVYFNDKNSVWHELGTIGDGDNPFPLNPTWLDDVAVYGRLYLTVQNAPPWDDWWWDTAMINTSTLEVDVVPVPGAVLLGILGLSVAGVKLRKFA